MIEAIIEPAQYLIDALYSKTAKQLIDIITMSSTVDKLSVITIHLTAIDVLMSKFPREYELLMFPNASDYEQDY